MERLTDGLQDAHTKTRDALRFGVGNEVDVAAAHAHLFAEIAVKVRQGANSLGGHLPTVGENRQFTAARGANGAVNEEVVTDVHE